MSTNEKRVAVAGAGGMGREALAWLRDARPDVEAVAFFVADASERPSGAELDLPTVNSLEDLRSLAVTGVLLGIGDNLRRGSVLTEVVDGGFALLSVAHPTAFIGPGVAIGEGCLIAPGVILTRDIVLNGGTIVNYGARVGHDCSVGPAAFLGPGSILTGDVVVGAGAAIGAGAVVLPGVRVGPEARVGAGAVVVRDVEAGSTVVGVPARTL